MLGPDGKFIGPALANDPIEAACGFIKSLVKNVGCELNVFHPNPRIGRHEFEQGLTIFLDEPRLHVGHDTDLVERFYRQLGSRVETAYAVNLIAKKFDAVGKFVCKGEYVYDAAAHGELPGLVN